MEGSGELVVRLEGEIVQRLASSAGVVTVGRRRGSDLVLDDPQVSRDHAEIRWDPAGLLLTDLDSANGTFVEGIRIPAREPSVLQPGSAVEIGPFVLTYEAVAAPAVAGEARQAISTDGGSLDSEESGDARQDKPTDPGSPEAWVSGEPGSDPAGPVVDEALARRDIREALVPAIRQVYAPPAPPSEPPRPTEPLEPLDKGSASRYRSHLPVPYQDSDFLRRFLLIFESIWEPLEQRQDSIHMYFDPRTCPSSFLPWLASWAAVPIQPHWAEPRLRRVLTEATELYRWRGTRNGLIRMIEVQVGLKSKEEGDEPPLVEIDESEEQPFVFHVRVTLPPGSEVDERFLDQLIRTHKPAHAGYTLEVQS